MNLFFRAVGLSTRFGSLSLLVFVLIGCGTPGGYSPKKTPTTAEPSAQEAAGSTDLLRPGDAVIVNFSGVVEPPPRVEDRINEDGFVTLPLIGPIKAAGHTRSQLQEIIRAKYVPQYYLRLNVSVNLDARYFYVSGEVTREGNYVHVGGMTVLKAIAAAGGFTDYASKTDVQVTRANGKVETINCNRVQKNPRTFPDPSIYPDDRIFVPRRLF